MQPATQATQTCPAASRRRPKAAPGGKRDKGKGASTSFASHRKGNQAHAKGKQREEHENQLKVLEEAYTQARKQVSSATRSTTAYSNKSLRTRAGTLPSGGPSTGS